MQGVADIVDIVHHLAEDIAFRVRVNIAQRQVGQFVVDFVAQIAHDGLRDARHDIVLNITEHRAQTVDAENGQQDFLYL